MQFVKSKFDENLAALVLADSCRACKWVNAGVVAMVANRVSDGSTAVASGSSSRCRRCSLWRLAQQAACQMYVQTKVCRG